MKNWNISLSIFPNQFHSGGAAGSDLIWSQCAYLAGHEVNIWSFEKHKAQLVPCILHKVTRAQLTQADPFLKIAAKNLGKNLPHDWFVMSLLQRNYFIIRDVQVVYGIGQIIGKHVLGGTGWGIDMCKSLDKKIYMYDQYVKQWFTWQKINKDLFDDFGWVACKPENPIGVWAGIGTRQINEFGIMEIQRLLDVIAV